MSTTAIHRPPRILIVDDNAAIHEDFKKILATPTHTAPRNALNDLEADLFAKAKPVIGRMQFRLESAFQGAEGLAAVQRAIAENDPYALVFMDIRMPPGWDGIETIERIWQVAPDAQVVLCSAYSDYSWDDLIGRFGHTDNLLILKKPFETVEVLQMAHALVKKWSLACQSRLWIKDIDRLVRERTQELVTTNEQLRTSEERFAKAFRTNPLPMAILRCDDKRFLDVNERFQLLSGFEITELLSHPATQLALWPEFTGTRIQALEAGRQLRNHSCKFSTRSGKTHDVLLWAEPISVADQSCVLLIVEDVTDRLHLETQLRQAQKLEAVGRLAAGVAHEFNNILTVIQGHAQLLNDQRMTPKQIGDCSQRINQASQRAAALTRQLLTFSRQQPMQLKLLNLSEVVGATQRMLHQLLGERYEVNFNCAPSLPLVRADGGSVEQILINLSLNARDAMPEGGRIDISTALVNVTASEAGRNPDARAGDFATLSIADEGCGISADLLRRVFDPFFTTKDVGKGTGLGLSIVHGIVRQHAGWIETSSAVGRGTVFTIYLPVGGPKNDGIDRSNAAPGFALQETGRGETILIVEDDASVRELTRAALERSGFRVTEAPDGRVALELWERTGKSIALVVTDLVLPHELSGAKLAAEIQTRSPRTPVIFISGYGTETIQAELPEKSLPGVNFLAKPFDPHALVAAVKAALDRSQTEAFLSVAVPPSTPCS